MSPPNGTTSEITDKYVAVPTTHRETDETNEEDVGDANDTNQTTNGLVPEATSNGLVPEATNKGLSPESATILNNPTKSVDVKGIIDDNNAEIVVPPDGGWGWVIVFASFMCNMIVDGIIFSFGMFLTDIQTDLKATKSQVSTVASLMAGFYLMAGPFVSALANRYGFRLVAIVGSIIGGVAFILSYFATSVQYLWLTYGMFGGIGFGLIYVPAVITVGFYFERWRALATGIGVCGSGIGCCLFAPIFDKTIKFYGWKNSILIQAAIVFSCAIFGILFRPVKPTKLKDLEKDKPELVMDIQKLPQATRIKMEKALDFMKAGSQASVNNNSEYPTVADVYHTISIPQHQRKINVISQEKRLSVPYIPEEDRPSGPLLKKVDKTAPIVIANRRNTLTKRARTTSESSQNRSRSDVNRPLYKDDIFFSGSLLRLPQYQSKSSVAYHLSITHLTTTHDIEEEQENQCKLCPEAVRRTLATMLDVSLLKSPSFLILAISGFLTMMGFYIPFMYMKDRAEMGGIHESTAVFLVSVTGIANTVGRVLCGILSSLPGMDTLLINNIAITIAGLATLVSGIWLTEAYQYTYAIIFGLCIACFASLRSILVVDLLGLEKLTNAFGLLLLFQGVAATLGTPMAGAFMEATLSYDASFYLSGSLILLSAVICYPLNVINRWERERNKEVNNQSALA